EQSLRRLGSDYIDLYQTHWPDKLTPIEETMAELLRLKQEGKIRAIGVSNVTVEQLNAYQKAGPLDSDQEKFSLLDREVRKTNLAWCSQHGVSFLAYSPLAQGLLTGKINLDREFPPGDLRSKKPRFLLENRARIISFLGEIQPVAETHGLTYGQLAIAWVINSGRRLHALVGARNPQQVMENVAAADVRLTADEMAAIEEALVRYATGII
ncbi:MAG TPA: aldo/keto reductase, partial [bacterium]|nr:aldo/keto reductase [bacterium]